MFENDAFFVCVWNCILGFLSFFSPKFCQTRIHVLFGCIVQNNNIRTIPSTLDGCEWNRSGAVRMKRPFYRLRSLQWTIFVVVVSVLLLRKNTYSFFSKGGYGWHLLLSPDTISASFENGAFHNFLMCVPLSQRPKYWKVFFNWMGRL